MKIKIKITTGDESVVRVATKVDNTITYKEAPNITVTLTINEDSLIIEKKGAINYRYTYKNEERSKLLYIVELSGNKFEGSSEVTTLKYENNDKQIYLKCLVNSELTKIKWEEM